MEFRFGDISFPANRTIPTIPLGSTALSGTKRNSIVLDAGFTPQGSNQRNKAACHNS